MRRVNIKVKILTVGTRGDVQPFLALALELKKSNYDVTICTGENFKGFIEGAGVSFAPVSVDYLKLTQSDAGKEMMSGNLLTILRSMKTVVYPMMAKMLDDLWLAAQDADVLVYTPKVLGGYDIAEKLGIPAFIAHPVPIIQPTELFTNPALPFSFENGFLNKQSYYFNKLASIPFMKIINKWRIEKLGLATERSNIATDLRLKGWDIPVLYGCSPSVIPYDPKWEGRVAMFGFWYLDEKEEWTPSEALNRFIKEGTPPIAINFSSMPLTNPNRVKKMITEALYITGQRGVLISGWSGMQKDNCEGNIFFADSIPHLWLFPKTVGVIHHGGAGTTAAALKAGKPMIICPFSGDQPFWARMVRKLGVSTPELKEKDMSTDAFAQRIRSLSNEKEILKTSLAIAGKINAENGLANTVQFINYRLKRR